MMRSYKNIIIIVMITLKMFKITHRETIFVLIPNTYTHTRDTHPQKLIEKHEIFFVCVCLYLVCLNIMLGSTY